MSWFDKCYALIITVMVDLHGQVSNTGNHPKVVVLDFTEKCISLLHLSITKTSSKIL